VRRLADRVRGHLVEDITPVEVAVVWVALAGASVAVTAGAVWLVWWAATTVWGAL